MLSKVFYLMALDKDLAALREKPSHSLEELDALAHDMPVRDMLDAHGFAGYCRRCNLSLADCMTMLAWVFSQRAFLSDIKVTGDVSFQSAVDFYERARVNTIIIHRLNYIMHESMVVVYNLLEDDGRLKFGVKRSYGNAEKLWDGYLSDHRRQIERTAWVTFLDHMRLANDAVTPYVDGVYEAIRDYMIFLGFRDVEVKARCMTVLFLGKVVRHSFTAFFKDFEKECGVDYTKCFSFDDMQPMVSYFAQLCDGIGIKTERDDNGCWTLRGFDAEQNLRFRTAWKKLISVLRDDDIMDETAKQAIGLNPEAQKEYQHILVEEHRKAMDAEIEKLGEKYNVKKVS